MEGLNNMQQLACQHVDGPMLILAGAGSGKTRVITHRVVYLMEEVGVNPLNILAITFTNKAAKEMRERVDLIAGAEAGRVWVSTFHSLCVRILKRYADKLGYGKSFDVYDTGDQKTVMKEILKDLKIDTKKYPDKMFLSKISKAKEGYISPDELYKKSALDFSMRQVAEVYQEYQSRLFKNNAMDFDDLIYKTVELFEHNPDVLDSYQNRFRYIMVDEYQDTNHIQFLLVKMLASKFRNLCVVGDDDQSIYKFRGANITNILNFEDEYPDAKVVKLEQNYRSCGNILAAANAVIHNNGGRKDKALWTEAEDGEKISYDLCDTGELEAENVALHVRELVRQGVPYSDIAVLYRTNAQSRLIGDKMVRFNIPYRVYGGRNFYELKEIKDIMAYLKLVNNATDDLYFSRVVNEPKRGIGAASISKIGSYASACGISMLQAATRADEIPGMTAKTSAKIKDFGQLIVSFQNMVRDGERLDEILDRILQDTGYEDMLINERSEEAMTRLENIDEFRNTIAAFVDDNEEGTLDDFLGEIALVSDIDNLKETANHIKLMTLHSAKGLEFPYVFICGMEERMFPSAMSMYSDDDDELEEERRLCYVGITRAMKKLFLSSASSRYMHGSEQFNEVSRFVLEIPANLFEHEKTIEYIKRGHSKFGDESGYDEEGRGNYGYGNSSTAGYGGYGERSFTRNDNYGKNGGRGGYGNVASGGYGSYGGGSVFNENVRVAKTHTGYKSTRTSGKNNPYPEAFGKTFKVQMLDHLDYKEGDKVKHIKFGIGVVQQIEKNDKDFQVTVDFERTGIRKLPASYAKLKKIED
jgi:DNA helicase-2/ATP-dependent DNA helicase PcrA